MREKPIIFSTQMVQAILQCRKTQTRRVIKPQPPEEIETLVGPYYYEPTMIDKNGEAYPGDPILGVTNIFGDWGTKSPYVSGDILWVRETWCTHNDLHVNSFDEDPLPGYYYKADALKCWANNREVVKWHPSIHMPREAARIFLEVADVRVERLQEIMEKDAIAEGCGAGHNYGDGTARTGFAMLWDSINAKRGYGWETNPWVWVIEFRVKEVKK